MVKPNRSKKLSSGSLANSEPDFLIIGKLQKPHGVDGEIKLNLSSNITDIVEIGLIVYVGKAKEKKKINRVRGSDKHFIIGFKDIKVKEAVRDFTNQYVYIKYSRLPKLVDSFYYHHDLIGLSVVNENGREIGIVDSIITTGSNDVYVVRPHEEGQVDILIPAISSVVLEINLQLKTMTVRPQEYY